MHLQSARTAFALLFWLAADVIAQDSDPLLPCGDAFYHASEVSNLGKEKKSQLMHDLSIPAIQAISSVRCSVVRLR